jgi:dTDP-4-dehydrorhamnose 3,5-epimerase
MAEIKSLGIQGAWIIESEVYGDNRGFFREWFQTKRFKDVTGIEFNVQQANLSTSSKGVVRGIHYSLSRVGQAKLVTCARGLIWDVVVDIRPKSPTFKKWVATELRPNSGTSVFISEGLGHAFMSLENESVITYLLSTPYSPKEEFAINPLDPEINIEWPGTKLSFSARDKAAPLLKDAQLVQTNLAN